MKKILITGAGSYIGTSFEEYMKQWPDEYQVDTLDMIGDGWMKYDFSGYDAVYHVAGIAHSDNGKISREKAKQYYEVNTKLTIRTAMKAKKAGVKQFIFMSSAIVYGDSAPIGKKRIITKDTPVSPANCYGDSKVRAEKGLRKLEDENFKVVILRPPMIYGKGSKGNYPLMSKLAQKLPVFPMVDNCRSMLYIENLMEFVRLMIENEEQGTFWPQNAEYSNTSELVRMIAAEHGKRVTLLKGCTLPLRIAGLATGLVDKAFGNLAYDQKLSEYKEEYRKYLLRESIRRTEDNSMDKKRKRKKKICLISSSGGHYEQLQMLKPLGEKHDIFWVTEKADYSGNADYYLLQTGTNEFILVFLTKMLINSFKTIGIWIKEKPDVVVTTGTMIALPVSFLAKLLRKKVIYIETFARIYDCTRAGKLMYKFADLFIYQWEPLKKHYPKGVYGGSIY